jgi:AmmeMemoRadiSam system protein A
MNTKLYYTLWGALLILATFLVLMGTTHAFAKDKQEPVKAQRTKSPPTVSTEPEEKFRTIEPIAIIFEKSLDSLTTGSEPFRLLRGKRFDSVIFISDNKETKSGVVRIAARGVETKGGTIDYDSSLAKSITRNAALSFSADSQAHLDSKISNQLAELRRVLGAFKAVVLLANLDSLSDAERLADAVVNTTFGKDILIAGAAHIEIDSEKLRNLPPNRRLLAFEKQLETFITEKSSGSHESNAYPPSQKVAKTVFEAARALGYNRLLLSPALSTGKTVPRVIVFAYEPLALTDAQKDSLLRIARKSLEDYVRTGKTLTPEPTDDVLLHREAGFVTLTENGALRGCIGTIFPHAPIAEAVSTNAVRAAVSDPRFRRVTEGELSRIKVEVTVFTSRMKPVKMTEEIQIGRDGLYIRKGFNSGIFLPQVPVEFGWDKMQYLQQLCGKAGLPPDAWKDAELYRYTGIYFGE